MKNIFSIFLLLLVSFGYSQNKEYSVVFDHLFLADESKTSNTNDSKIKLKFSSLDNGNYFVFNRLMYGNKTGKVLAYFKPFNTVVIRSQDKLTYLTFKEAFPNGGFYKTTTSKMIFGQPANLYALDNDVLDIKLWVASGARTGTGFDGYLNDMGLLQNLPKDNTIIAVTILGIEFGMSNFKEEKDKNFKSHLNDVLVSFKEPKDSLLACVNEKNNKEKPLNASGEKISLLFDYKITSNISLTDSKGKFLYNTNTLIYTNKNNTVSLQVIDEQNAERMTFIYTNKELGQIIEGTHNNDKLFMEKGITTDSQNCITLTEKLISKKNNTKHYIAGYEHEFGLFSIEKNNIDFPSFQNQTTSNGFITKRIYLNKDLEKQEYTSKIELGNFKFNLEK